VLYKYGFASGFRKFFAGAKHAERFTESGQRLSVTHNILCHALSIHMAMDASDRDHEQHEMLKQALETDCRLHHADVQSAIQTPSLLGVSPDELSQAMCNLQLVAHSESGTAPAAHSSGGSGPTLTLADLQRCSWRIRSSLLTFELKEDRKSKVWLGSGTFGDVYAATYCGERVIVKKMKCPINCDAAQSASGSQALASFLSEVSLACALNHPNIVHTLGGVVEETKKPPCWIVMERLDQSLPKVQPNHLQR
jgi:hypothetical protein